MNDVSRGKVFAAPRTAALAAAVLIAVPFLLWYQSSRKDKGTDNGISRYNTALFNNNVVGAALSGHPERDEFLLIYVGNLYRYGYRTAPLTWLKFGAERGSAKVMLVYADVIAASAPAEAAMWRKRAAEAGAGNFSGGVR